MKRILPLLLALTCLSGQSHGQNVTPTTDLTVSAAASLQDALRDIGPLFERAHPGVKVRFNFGSSGTLQRQIEQGAPVDVFLSAADKNMDELAAQKLIETNTRRSIAGNSLVLIAPKSSHMALRSFKDVAKPSVARVAIGGPSVPAGMRAQEVFTRLGIWPQVQAKAVRGKDVREVLTQVEQGNVEAGVVYRTDALSSSRVRLVTTAPASMHKPIRYPAAVVAGSRVARAAREFVVFLVSPPARALLRRRGFMVR